MKRHTTSLSSVVLFLVIFISCLIVGRTADEVCCCPDFNLKLTATESDTIKSVENGYMFVAKEGTDVTFNCELDDKDHPAIKSVSIEYEFWKAWELQEVKPINFYTSKSKNVCAKSASSSCTVNSVTYSADPVTDSDTADNHYYQCGAHIVLIDDSVVSIYSSTVRLDVYKAPTYLAPEALTKTAISEGKAWEMFACTLPEANPPVKAKWSYKEKNGADYEDIDYNSGRGHRLAVMDEQLTASAENTFNIYRGYLILMVFIPSDAGNYKCYGEWDPSPLALSTFGSVQGSTEITDYSLDDNPASTDTGALQLNILSEIPSKVTLNQDSEVSFTVFSKDTPGRGPDSNFKDVVYTWKLDGEALPNDPDNLVLSDFDRTLTIKNMLKYADDDKKFQLEVKRDYVENDQDETTSLLSSEFSITKKCDVVPRYLYVPLTYKRCLAMDAPIVVKVSLDYMMDSEDTASANPKQILFAVNNKTSYYVHDWPKDISYLFSDDPTEYNTKTDLSISTAKIQELEDGGTTLGSCVYVRNSRLSTTVYSIVEPTKIQRITGGCGEMPADFCSTPANYEITETEEGANTKLTITFTSPVPQCVLADLKKIEPAEVLEPKKTAAKTAATCEGREITISFDSAIPTSDVANYKINVYTEGNAGCDIIFEKKKDKSKAGLIVGIVVAVVVVLAVIGFAFYKYTECNTKCKKELINEINEKLPAEKTASNFTTDWSDGTRLACLVNSIAPSLITDYKAMDPRDKVKNLEIAMDTAKTSLGVDPEPLTPKGIASGNADADEVSKYLKRILKAKVKKGASAPDVKVNLEGKEPHVEIADGKTGTPEQDNHYENGQTKTEGGVVGDISHAYSNDDEADVDTKETKTTVKENDYANDKNCDETESQKQPLMEEPAKNDEVVLQLQVQDVDSHIYSNDDTNDDTSEAGVPKVVS